MCLAAVEAVVPVVASFGLVELAEGGERDVELAAPVGEDEVVGFDAGRRVGCAAGVKEWGVDVTLVDLLLVSMFRPLKLRG